MSPLVKSIVLTLAWGAFAFGGVYPWSYWPLLIGCATAGVACHLLASRTGRPAISKALMCALGVVALLGLLQIMPLSESLLLRISPSSNVFLKQAHFEEVAVASVRATDIAGQSLRKASPLYALSARPVATSLAVACFISFGLFMTGIARAFTSRDAVQLARGVTALGAILALVAIVARASFAGKIYGFWQPYFDDAHPFGPFINRNHFAGWMLMALPLALSYVCALVTRIRPTRPGWRHRLLWLSSGEASEVLLAAFGIVMMGLSLVLTLSRSGMIGLAVGVLAVGVSALRRQIGRPRRAMLAGYIVMVVLVSVSWAGTDAVIDRFGKFSDRDIEGRLYAWRQALSIMRDFPVVGTGLNTFGAAVIFYQTDLNRYYRATHNDYLQLAAEGGILIGVPIAILIAIFVREVRHRFRDSLDNGQSTWLRTGAVAGLVAIAAQEMVDFSLQIPANAALFAVLAAIALHVTDPTPATRCPGLSGVPPETAPPA
jgi:putative inorganic carbon (HCO3(-)) transporter